MVEEGTEDDQFKAVMDEAKEVSAFSSLCVELQFFFDKFIIATLQKIFFLFYSLCTQEAGISTSEGPDNSSEEIVVEYNHNDYADLIGTFMMLLLLLILLVLILLVQALWRKMKY